MKKSIIIAMVVGIVVLLIIGVVFSLMNNKKEVVGNVEVNANPNPVQTEQVVVSITKDNLPGFLVGQQVVKDIPEKAVLMLRFYNFNSGERQWEESYVIKKNSVEKASTEEYDVMLIMDSKYLSDLGDLCGAVKKAKANNDFGFESEMSSTEFMWKYKSMLKYKDCFGF